MYICAFQSPTRSVDTTNNTELWRPQEDQALDIFGWRFYFPLRYTLSKRAIIKKYFMSQFFYRVNPFLKT